MAAGKPTPNQISVKAGPRIYRVYEPQYSPPPPALASQLLIIELRRALFNWLYIFFFFFTHLFKQFQGLLCLLKSFKIGHIFEIRKKFYMANTFEVFLCSFSSSINPENGEGCFESVYHQIISHFKIKITYWTKQVPKEVVN